MAHIGDSVEVFPTLGMDFGACQATHATGSVYIASGLLVHFLEDVTLNGGFIYTCPTNTSPPCKPGPYLVTITPALVGAGVVTPLGSVPGVPGYVRVVENGVGLVRSGEVLEPLHQFHGDSIAIVSACIQVSSSCDLPVGKSCFPTNGLIHVRGTVTNCGAISLANVFATDSRAGALVIMDPVSGFPLPTNPSGGVFLALGAYGTFTFSYAPTGVEIASGSASSSITARGTDTSDFGGPRASVTNSATSICPICGPSTAPGELSIWRLNQNAVLDWTGTYHLQISSNLAGPYLDIPSVLTGPFTNPLGAGSRFYRLRE